MLHVCYIYVDILNYDVTLSHHIYAYISIVNFCCIHFEIILNISSICYTFNNTIHKSYLFKLQLVDICIIMSTIMITSLF